MDPYIGEIRMFAGPFAPVGWMLCNGQQMPIAENTTLFDVIGTTYGGDGQTNFNLPDLRGRVPLAQGAGQSRYVIGQVGGAPNVTLTVQQTPAHTHSLTATTAIGTQSNPGGALLANSQIASPYIQEDPDNNMGQQMVLPAGGNQPHENRQPFLVLNFIIAVAGIFPTP